MLKKRTDGRALFLRVPGQTPGGAMAVGSICLVVSVHRLFLTVVPTYPCRQIYRMFRRRNLRTGTQWPLRLVTRREGATFIMINVHRRTADPLRPLRLEVRPALDRPPAQVRGDHVHVAEGFHVFVVRFVTVFRVSVLVNSAACILASAARNVERLPVSALIAPHRLSSASCRVNLRRAKGTRR